MRIILCIVGILLMQTTFSQNNSDKLGNWFMYNGSHKLSDKWAIKTMAHFRYYEIASNFQQEIYRLGVNHSFHKNLNFTLGYSYVTTDIEFGDPDPTVFENRIYEDINYTNRINKLKLRHRFRFEHRFITSQSIKSDSHWFRYDLNLSYPISKNWSVYVFNEIFFNMDRKKRFVQNWTGFGFLHQLNQSLKLNLGYQQIKLTNNVQKRLLLGIVLNTDHQKK